MKNLQTSSVLDILGGNTLAMADFSNASPSFQSSFASGKTTTNNGDKKFKGKKLLPLLLVVIAVGIIGTIVVNNANSSQSSSPALLGASDKRVDVEKPTAQETLNKTFNFPLRDAAGKEVSKLKYEIQNAELRDEIIVKGQKATAVKGRTFLIINLKITNNYDKSIQLNSKDYIRLIVSGSPEKLAADIHNDPVDVQAISTKFTRLGFPIDDDQKSLTLQVGEISGKKETVTLNLK